jgi:hypothetical protein
MKKLAILLFGAFALATSANAAVVFNFDLEADTTAGGTGEAGYQPLDTTLGTFNLLPTGLIAKGWYQDETGADILVHAYLDGPSGSPPKRAGLGVCSTGLTTGGECVNNKDDNIGHGPGAVPTGSPNLNTHEWLSLDITNVAGDGIQGMRFKGIGHDPAPDDGVVDYRVNGGAWMSATFGALSIMFLDNVQTLDLAMGGAFNPNQNHDGHLEDQFYLASMTVVPVPAAVWLFGTAMLGLIGLRRKTKMNGLAA